MRIYCEVGWLEVLVLKDDDVRGERECVSPSGGGRILKNLGNHGQQSRKDIYFTAETMLKR